MFAPTSSILDQDNNSIALINRRLTCPSTSDPGESKIYDDASYELHLTRTTNQFSVRINASSLFRSSVNVVVLTPVHWECRIFLDNTRLPWSLQHYSDGSQNIWTYNAEITDYTLPQPSINFQLQIFTHTTKTHDTCAYVLAPSTKSHSDPTRLVHQISDTTFSAAMATRHVLLWLALFLAIFIISAHIPHLQSVPEPFERAYSFILPIFVILFPMVFDRTLIPRYIRFVSALFYRWKKSGWTALVALIAPIYIFSALIVHCIYEQNVHQSTVEAYISTTDPDYLLRALVRYPSRIDTRYAYERITADLRDQGTEKLHSYVSTITSHPLFTVAIDKAKNGACSLCGTKDARELLHPLVWIASILPEAEAHDEVNLTKRAYNLLADRPELDAKLQSIILQFYFVESAQRPQLISNLKRLLSQTQIRLAESEVAQVATDHLAVELLIDLVRNKTCAHAEFDPVLALFEQIINARTSISGNSLQWLRPPDKMQLYQLFMGLSGEHDTEAEIIRAYRNICDGTFYSRFKERLYDRKKEEGYYLASDWRRGTSLGPTEDGRPWKEYVLQTLAKENWRY